MEEVRFVEVKCLRSTAEGMDYYTEGQQYTVPENHPCMQHFEPLREVRQKEVDERAKDEQAMRERQPPAGHGFAEVPEPKEPAQMLEPIIKLVPVTKDIPKTKPKAKRKRKPRSNHEK